MNLLTLNLNIRDCSLLTWVYTLSPINSHPTSPRKLAVLLDYLNTLYRLYYTFYFLHLSGLREVWKIPTIRMVLLDSSME